ncbi:MAG: hypothetical protein ABI298_07855 [Acidimicrobiales bacterium]
MIRLANLVGRATIVTDDGLKEVAKSAHGADSSTLIGVVMQESTTSDVVFPVAELIAYLSSVSE